MLLIRDLHHMKFKIATRNCSKLFAISTLKLVYGCVTLVTRRCTCHNEDEVRLIAVFVFLHVCVIVARHGQLIGMSPCGIRASTFASMFVKEAVSLKQWLLSNTLLAQLANIQGSRNRF